MTVVPDPRAQRARAVERPDRPEVSDSDESGAGLSKKPAPGVVKPGMDLQDEAALVEAARSDRAAFGRLYDRHFDAVYNYIARRVGGDVVLAEDLSAEVWERALTAIERYELRGLPFKAWLYRIAGNLIANHHRRRRLRQLVPFMPHHGLSRPQQRWDDRTTVQVALQALSEADQEVIGLYYFAGLTPTEIAEALGCSPVAVHKRLHRARERLKKRIQGDSGVA